MTNQDRASNLPELPEPQAWKYWHKVDSTKVATVSVRMDSAIKGADEYAEIPLFDADQMREYGRLCAATPASPAEVAPVRAVEAPTNPWADLWYFVMDEAPMEFERIVTTHSPKNWHTEAHKLMRAKYPFVATPAQATQGGAEPEEVGWSKAMRQFLSREYNKPATTREQIARQREIGALIDAFDRTPK